MFATFCLQIFANNLRNNDPYSNGFQKIWVATEKSAPHCKGEKDNVYEVTNYRTSLRNICK